MHRQDFGNLKRVGFGPDRLERSAVLRGGLRFHVPQIHVAGGAEIKNHNAGLVLMARPYRARLLGCQYLRQRQAHRAQRPDLQKLPPFQVASATNRRLLFAQKIKHNVVPK